MKRLAVTLAVILLSIGCTPGCASADLDPIMGRTDGTPVVETQQLDCDLIFPGPSDYVH